MKTTKEWRVEDYVGRLMPQQYDLTKEFQSNSRKRINDEDVTLEMVRDCLIIVAHIIKNCGEQYLPVFERLSLELENREKQQDL